jgi:hypothetical protein
MATVGGNLRPRTGTRRRRRLVAGALPSLLVTVVGAGGPPDRAGDTPDALVRRLYAAHQPWRSLDVMYRGDALDEASLRRFLDEALLGLLRRDEQCKARTGDVGAVDFDPFLDAQDFGEAGIDRLQVGCTASGRTATCAVSFLAMRDDPASVTRLSYHLSRQAAGWRIGDIAWAGRRETMRDRPSRPCGR